jgi:topoisomerase IA-like protein
MDDQPITAAIGPYGAYLKYNNTYTTLKANEGDVLTVGAEAAKRIVTEGLSKKSSKYPLETRRRQVIDSH